MTDRWDRRFNVRVLSPDYKRVTDVIADYQTVSCTWTDGVGTATLAVPARGQGALRLLAAAETAAPVVFQAPGFPRWSGQVTAVSGAKTNVDEQPVPLIVATLVDHGHFFKRIRVSPDPLYPWNQQGRFEFDYRIGTLDGLVRYYVRYNVARLANEGNPVPIQVPLNANDTSPAGVILKGRNQTIEELVSDALKFHGYRLTADLWLPGDPQPYGLALTEPTVVADVVKGKDRPWVRFTDVNGGVATWTVTASQPQAMGVVVGGPGEGTNRTFQKVMATDGRVASYGRWGYPEEWLDATDTDPTDTALRTQRGLEKLEELAGKRSVQVTVDDRRPWVAGPDADYWVGDLVRAEFVGVQVSDRVRRVTATDNQDGFQVSAIIGETDVTETTDKRIARAIAELRHRLSRQEVRR